MSEKSRRLIPVSQMLIERVKNGQRILLEKLILVADPPILKT
jgi:hypothetical protein